MEDPSIRRRDANESPDYLGMGNRVSPQCVAITTRTFCGRCVSGRCFPAETTGGDSSSSTWYLSTSSELSSWSKFNTSEFNHSGSCAHDRIFRSPRYRDECALETRHPPRRVLLDNCRP